MARFRSLFGIQTAVAACLIAATVSVASAKGRRGDYVSTGEEEQIQPVQRGSAANPNPAFAPPRFDDSSAPSAAPRRAATTKTNPPPSNNSNADVWGTANREGSSSSASKQLDIPTPPPAPKAGDSITAPDSSEPPALDLSPETPNGVHPPAK